MIETQPTVDPHHRLPVQDRPQPEIQVGHGGQIGKGGGQVRASARPQACAARRPYHRDPESVELHLVPTTSRARRVLRDCICRSSKGEVHRSHEPERNGSRSGHASRMRGCTVDATPDLGARARSKWGRTHTDGSAHRRRPIGPTPVSHSVQRGMTGRCAVLSARRSLADPVTAARGVRTCWPRRSE
jgi:hypothetical protein